MPIGDVSVYDTLGVRIRTVVIIIELNRMTFFKTAWYLQNGFAFIIIINSVD